MPEVARSYFVKLTMSGVVTAGKHWAPLKRRQEMVTAKARCGVAVCC